MAHTTPRQQLTKEIEALQHKYAIETHGRAVPTPKALRILRQLNALKEEAAVLDREAASRLALSKAPIEDVLEVIAIPLLADVMYDLITGVNQTLRSHGCQETVFGEYARQIRRAAVAMVDTLNHAEEGLPRLLDVDDTLVDAVRKKLMSFIKQRLHIKK